jgi:hypothetical protein
VARADTTRAEERTAAYRQEAEALAHARDADRSAWWGCGNVPTATSAILPPVLLAFT